MSGIWFKTYRSSNQKYLLRYWQHIIYTKLITVIQIKSAPESIIPPQKQHKRTFLLRPSNTICRKNVAYEFKNYLCSPLDFTGEECYLSYGCASFKDLDRFSGDHSLWHLLCRCFLLLRDQLLRDGSLFFFFVIDQGPLQLKREFCNFTSHLSISAASDRDAHA